MSAGFHKSLTIVDSHCDTILEWVNKGRDLVERSTDGHVDLPRLAEGGVDVQFFACYIEPQFKPDRGLPRALELIDAVHRLAAEHPERMEIACKRADIDRIVESGRLAVVLAIEGGEGFGFGPNQQVLAGVRMLHRLSVRLVTLTWNERNLLADGAAEERTGGGLSSLGVEVVREMNRLGMIIDVSHLSVAGFWQTLETSTKPVMASHSNARALCDHRRNLSDVQLRALAENGGLVAVTFVPSFLSADPEQASLDTVVAHIDHIAGLIGPERIGIGSDFDGIAKGPRGLEDATRFPNLTEALLRRGFSEDQVRGIMGENQLRFFAEVVG